MSLMPMRPANQTKQVVIEQPDTTALFNALEKLHNQPTIVTLQQFKQFEPLFRKEHKLSPDDLKELTKLYLQTFDFYKSTVIIESADNPKPVLTLPPVFTPVRSLEINDQNALLVDINSKLSGGMPLYSSTAFGHMADALIREQLKNKEVIENYREVYQKTVDTFLSIYGDKISEGSVAEVAPDAPSSINTAEWDFE